MKLSGSDELGFKLAVHHQNVARVIPWRNVNDCQIGNLTLVVDLSLQLIG